MNRSASLFESNDTQNSRPATQIQDGFTLQGFAQFSEEQLAKVEGAFPDFHAAWKMMVWLNFA